MPCFGSHHRWITRTSENSVPTSATDHPRPAVEETIVMRPVITTNLRTRRHFGVRSSKWPKRMLPTVKSEAITATSIHRFTASLLADESLPQKVGVEQRDDHRHRPRERLHPQRGREGAHLVAIAGEHHEREDRERQLQAQNHLAEDQQLPRPALAVQRH